MSTMEITAKIKELKELKALVKEAEIQIGALEDAIKAEMAKQNSEEMVAGIYIVRWTSVTSSKFDSNAFKKNMPDLYEKFIKQVNSRRFSISG